MDIIKDNVEREFLFQIHFWDQSHVTIVWNTRETGDIVFSISIWQKELVLYTYLFSWEYKYKNCMPILTWSDNQTWPLPKKIYLIN